MMFKLRTKKIFFTLLTSFLIIIFLGLCTRIGFIFYSAYQDTNIALSFIEKAQKNLRENDLKESKENLATASFKLKEAEKELSKIIFLKKVPYLGQNISGFFYLTKATSLLLDSGLKLIFSLDFLDPFLAKDFKGLKNLSAKEKREILFSFEEKRPLFLEIEKDLEKAKEDLNKVPSSLVIAKISKSKEKIEEKQEDFSSLMKSLAIASKIVPQALGLDKNQKYLLLFQNNSELRPTGGIISAYGILEIKDGEIKRLEVFDSSRLDRKFKEYVEPPLALKEYWYETGEGWKFADSNFSPDFPSSVAKIKELYFKEGGEGGFETIIAIDPVVLSSLLKITGTLSLKNYPYTLTFENVLEKLQYHVEINYQNLGLKEEERKKIIGDLASDLIYKVFSFSSSSLLSALNVIKDNLSQKHILIYSDNPEIKDTIFKANWDGRIKEEGGDYLGLFDTNLGGWKSDIFIERKIDYKVRLEEKKAKASLSILYKHKGDYDWKTSIYKTYARIYLPKKIELLSEEGGVPFKLSEDLGKSVLEGYFTLEPKKEIEIKFNFLLNDEIASLLQKDKYQILIQKQPGTERIKVNIDIETKNKKKNFKTDLLKDEKLIIDN